MSFPSLFPFPFPEAEITDLGRDHIAAALDRLAQYLRNQPKIESLVTDLATQAQDAEGAFQELRTDRSLDSSFGAGLDAIGAIVGEARTTTDDSVYRLRIKARMLLNRDSGTAEEIIAIFSLLEPSQVFEIKDEPPAGFSLHLEGGAISSDSAAILLGFLRLARAAGIRGILQWDESDPGDMFAFDSGGLGLDQGAFSGDGV